MNVTILSCTAGLLLMLTLNIGVALDGLSVSDLLRYYIYGYSVSVLQLSLDDSELDVSLSAEKSLMCLSISLEYECRILFHESCKTLSHLLVFILVCCFYSDEVAWAWECDSRDSYLLVLSAECVAGLGVLELSESNHVTCDYSVCHLLVLSSYEEYGTELFRLL